MSRVKRGTVQRARHKKVLAAAKGHYGRRKNVFRVAKQSVDKALQYNYRDRKNRKRNFRSLWIQRINAGAREHGMRYSELIHGLALAEIEIDRKVLADLAAREPEAFAEIVKQAKTAWEKDAA